MGFFQSLFATRRSLRHFARLDSQGICRAFKHCRQAPEGAEWVEVTEQRLAWLGQPLPASARLATRTRAANQRLLLAV